jgi:hypothetical protein
MMRRLIAQIRAALRLAPMKGPDAGLEAHRLALLRLAAAFDAMTVAVGEVNLVLQSGSELSGISGQLNLAREAQDGLQPPEATALAAGSEIAPRAPPGGAGSVVASLTRWAGPETIVVERAPRGAAP